MSETTQKVSMNELSTENYWIMFVALIVIGGLKVLLNQRKIEKGRKMITQVSIVLSIITGLFLAMTREAYAIAMTFLLLIIKGMLVLKTASEQ